MTCSCPWRAAVFTAVYGLCALSSPSLAQSEPALDAWPEPPAERVDMRPVDMLSLHYLDGVQLSPDGDFAIVTRSVADWREDERVDQFWHFDTASGTFNYLEGLDDSDSIAISPDGTRLAIDRPPEGRREDEVFIAAQDGSDLQRLTRHSTSVRDVSWSPDGRWIYFLANDDYTEAERDDRERFARVDPYFETPRHRHLWRVDVETGDTQRMTQGDWSVRDYHLADSGRLLVRIAPAGDLDSAYASELWVSETDEPAGPMRQVTRNDWMEGRARLSPDGRHIAYRARVTADGLSYVQYKLVVIDLDNQESRILTPDASFEVDDLAWMPDGRGVVVSVQDGPRSGLVRVDLESAAVTEVSMENRHLVDWSQDGSGRILAVFQTPDSLGDLWLLDPQAAARRLTGLGAAELAGYRVPEQRHIQWRSHDGARIEGFYFPPLNPRDDGPPPLVVQAHGGPRSADEFGQWKWSRFVPVLSARGYAVLWVNYRGGTGYGDAFMQGMQGAYFAHAGQDVLTGVDALVAQGLADPDRLVMTGWSAGGHLTNHLITRTGRFRAAMSGAGAVDWAAHHLTSDTRQARRLLMGADAWAEGALDSVFVPQSVLRDLHRASTPTLIFAGEDDERVHPSQSIMLYQALRNLGVETQFYLVAGEGHSFSDLSNRLFRLNTELDWYARHLGLPDHDWQSLPSDALEDEEPSDES